MTGHYPVLAECDVAATEAAWQLADERYCELWNGERLVAFIERRRMAAGGMGIWTAADSAEGG